MSDMPDSTFISDCLIIFSGAAICAALGYSLAAIIYVRRIKAYTRQILAEAMADSTALLKDAISKAEKPYKF